MNSAYLEEI